MLYGLGFLVFYLMLYYMYVVFSLILNWYSAGKDLQEFCLRPLLMTMQPQLLLINKCKTCPNLRHRYWQLLIKLCDVGYEEQWRFLRFHLKSSSLSCDFGAHWDTYNNSIFNFLNVCFSLCIMLIYVEPYPVLQWQIWIHLDVYQ